MVVYWLSNELAKRGHSVDVFHCEDSYNLLQKATVKSNFPNHPNINITRLKSYAGIFSPLLTQQTGIPFFKQKLKNGLDTKTYDVIHYHNISLIGITALSYGSARVKLYTMHEHWLVCPMHVLWKFDREICLKKDCTACQLVGKRPPQLWRHTGLLEKMVKNIDCFISPSQFTLKKHLEMGLNIPIKHIPNFFPTSPTAIKSIKKQNDEIPYFLFVGRLEKFKGLQTIIPVFKEKTQHRLLIAGEGKYRNELEKLAENSPNIVFLGKVEQNILKGLYNQSIAVIVPSICYETFGMVIIEAFSMKSPVIVNNLGALPEVVEKSGGGFIYNNQAELIAAIEQLASNKALRDDLGNKGYAAFMKYWNIEAHLTEYFDLIEKIQNKCAIS